MAFQNWVAYGRTSSPAVRPKEHLTCPLLWCRHRFDSLASCLQHVSVCPWLSNGYYWCPRCQRAERFTPEDPASSGFSATATDKKLSKLKRAVTFFKHFGRKSPIQGHSLHSRASSPTRQISDGQGTSRPSSTRKPSYAGATDSETTPGSIRTFHAQERRRSAILDDFDFELASGERPDTLYDMEGNALSPFLDTTVPKSDTPELASSDPLFISSQLSDTGVLPYFDDGFSSRLDRFSERLPTHYGPFAMSFYLDEAQCSLNPGTFALEGPANEALEHWECGPSVESSDVPMADAIPASDLFSMQDGMCCDSDEMAVLTHISELPSPEVPESAVQIPGQVVPRRNMDNNDEDGQIRDLRQLVCGLHDHWLQEMRSTQELPYIKSTICGLNPFEAGIRSLQHCFLGSPPNSLEGVLSLMHFAFASASILHQDPLAKSWHDLFDDVLEWQSKIEAREDRCLYVKIVSLLWAPHEGPPLSQGSFPLQHRRDPTLSLENIASTLHDEANMVITDVSKGEDPFHDKPSQLAFPEPQPSDSQSFLLVQSSVVMKSCCQYLDGKHFPRLSCSRLTDHVMWYRRA